MRQRLHASALTWMLMLTGCIGEKRTTLNAADVYQSACANCHGARGTGGMPAREGAPAPRDFSETAWQESRTDAELAQIVVSGKGDMPSFADVLSPSEVEAVIAQVRAFGDRNGNRDRSGDGGLLDATSATGAR